MKTRIGLRLLLFAAVLVSLSSAPSRCQSKPDINKQIQMAITKIRKARTTTARLDAAERLVALTDERDCSEVTDETIHSMVSLLDLQDDGVRMWVAAALGDIGPRGKIAVPKLLSILAEVECRNWDHSSASTIPVALTRMGVTPPRGNCQH